MSFWVVGVLAAGAISITVALTIPQYLLGERLGGVLIAISSPVALLLLLAATFVAKMITAKPRRVRDIIEEGITQGNALASTIAAVDKRLPQPQIDDWVQSVRTALCAHWENGTDMMVDWEAVFRAGQPRHLPVPLRKSGHTIQRYQVMAGIEWLEVLLATGAPPASQSGTDSNGV